MGIVVEKPGILTTVQDAGISRRAYGYQILSAGEYTDR